MGFHLNDIVLIPVLGRRQIPLEEFTERLFRLPQCERKQLNIARHWSLADGN